MPLAAVLAYYAYAAYSSGEWPRTLPLPGGWRRQAMGILAMVGAVVATIVVIAVAVIEARRPRFHMSRSGARRPPSPPPIVVPRERARPARPAHARRDPSESPPGGAAARRPEPPTRWPEG